MLHRSSTRARSRRGSYTSVMGFLIPVVVLFTAMAVDGSWMQLASSQAQDSADAASHAALVELRRTGSTASARSAAERVLAQNRVGATPGEAVDILFGEFDRRSGEFVEAVSRPNAVRVWAGRPAEDPLNLYFGHATGLLTTPAVREATAAAQSVEVVLIIDTTISFADRDFYKARDAALAFLDVIERTHSVDDRIALVTFNHSYGVEYTPMFEINDTAALASARAEWGNLETVWRASVSGNIQNGERTNWCNFETTHRRAHMPRAYAKQVYNSTSKKWTTTHTEHSTDHTAGLLAAERILDRSVDPFAYKAIIMLTDGKPVASQSHGRQLRAECGYVEDRWTVHTSSIPHTSSQITTEYATMADDLWEESNVHLWNVSFVEDNPFLASSVQGDGKYYFTSNSDDLVEIFEEIAQGLPIVVVN